jgi:hypothetical protein
MIAKYAHVTPPIHSWKNSKKRKHEHKVEVSKNVVTVSFQKRRRISISLKIITLSDAYGCILNFASIHFHQSTLLSD